MPQENIAELCDEIKALKAQLAEARRAQIEATVAPREDGITKALAASRAKTAVLPNPHKKARKVQKMEFADDD